MSHHRTNARPCIRAQLTMDMIESFLGWDKAQGLPESGIPDRQEPVRVRGTTAHKTAA